MEMAQRIANEIGAMDGLIFPEDPIPEIAIVRMEPPKNRVISYVPKGEGEDEHYSIYGYGLDKWVERELKIRIILLRDWEEGHKRYEDHPQRTLAELLVGIAAHEVRHRLQYLDDEIQMFSPEDAERIEDPYGWRLVEFQISYFANVPPEDMEGRDYRKEFDAEIIERWAREEFHWWLEEGQPWDLRDFPTIIPRLVSIVKSEPKHFIESRPKVE